VIGYLLKVNIINNDVADCPKEFLYATTKVDEIMDSVVWKCVTHGEQAALFGSSTLQITSPMTELIARNA
jgi:hypothetical protein